MMFILILIYMYQNIAWHLINTHSNMCQLKIKLKKPTKIWNSVPRCHEDTIRSKMSRF